MKPETSKAVFCFVQEWTAHGEELDPSFYSFPIFSNFWQMLTNAKHTLAYVTYTPLVLTHADRTCAFANLDMLEMDAIVQVLSIVSET